MMHLKNITAGNPKTKEQYQLTKQFNIKWLYSDDEKTGMRNKRTFSLIR
ncbi:tail fiber assembly protein (gpg) [Escherichia coli]|uniref:Tail fiber assembly protein (Gpg) n=1 Tax=Escherichia coli TaxID=562 RepID=A0A2X1N9L6_ECOLX|nr:tail fiber assembly protein (gpg) [Escherichia coli]